MSRESFQSAVGVDQSLYKEWATKRDEKHHLFTSGDHVHCKVQ
jgi:hypothetical protein